MDLFAEAFGALITEMETRPFEDVLGPYYVEFALSKRGQDRNGEFHTPKAVAWADQALGVSGPRWPKAG